MSLMTGTGPFGQHPGGTFNRDMPELKGLIYLESTPRRIRARLGGETVVDSRHAKLLHEHGHLPVYYFPEDELRADLLEPTDHHTTCPWKGEASYWTLRVGERVAENAVWGYDQPLDTAPEGLAGHRGVYWDVMDEWLEEDEPAIVHPRDPYHRVDVLDTSRHVRALVDGEPLADTSRARVIFETGLPPRWYVPPEDVRMDLLEPSDTRTGCAYKGVASYLSADGAEDVAWYYPEPTRDFERIRGYVAFFDERAEIEIDGERQERPVTQWS